MTISDPLDPSLSKRGALLHDLSVDTVGDELVITADVEGTRRELFRGKGWRPDCSKPVISWGITPLGMLGAPEVDQ